mmetsp:Transcript_77177/g.226383  ORF Transcript_77177/g.226383 Transcript_77177/m.226383 type:complete len:265 (+) Transcript_77177:1294-2088(+)
MRVDRCGQGGAVRHGPPLGGPDVVVQRVSLGLPRLASPLPVHHRVPLVRRPVHARSHRDQLQQHLGAAVQHHLHDRGPDLWQHPGLLALGDHGRVPDDEEGADPEDAEAAPVPQGEHRGPAHSGPGAAAGDGPGGQEGRDQGVGRACPEADLHVPAHRAPPGALQAPPPEPSPVQPVGQHRHEHGAASLQGRHHLPVPSAKGRSLPPRHELRPRLLRRLGLSQLLARHGGGRRGGCRADRADGQGGHVDVRGSFVDRMDPRWQG